MQLELADQLVRPVDQLNLPVGALDRETERIALIRSAQDRAAEVRDAAHTVAGQAHQPALRILLRQQQPVEPITDAVNLPAPVEGGERNGADYGVQTGASPPPVLIAIR